MGRLKFIIIYTKKEIHCDDLEDGYNVELKRKLYIYSDVMCCINMRYINYI